MSNNGISLAHVVRDLHLGISQAAHQFRVGELTVEELADQITSAHVAHDLALASRVGVPPCPAWCELPAGHPYETADRSDCGSFTAAARWHKRVFYRSPTFTLYVSAVEQLEVEEFRTHGPTTVADLTVSSTGELEEVSIHDLSTLARAIHAAAELLEQVNG